MLEIELEEKLMQAIAIIESLLNNPTAETIKIAQNFVEENGQEINLI
ncbi:hypothetical protein [Mucilaginibacter xinganensis]|uniref:Uncharacterized protein n=1 Tax=Mucilaginibacter xinganensis TaxID=1234841 RepID=A0A223NXR2_9SPHI|nr:hypothetical protein [Mucilaginibacter xinganensis]ASU34378.1 hypothetical protein MuYL_2491 [Mucilaginibacter xinganensis]